MAVNMKIDLTLSPEEKQLGHQIIELLAVLAPEDAYKVLTQVALAYMPILRKRKRHD